jgi:hypothetical protein
MLLLLLMTIAQLLAAAAENLSKAPGSISESTHQNHLVRSVNGGLAEFVQSLPDKRRVEPKTARLAAALSKTAGITEGSTALTFDPAWTAGDQSSYLGRTVVVAGSDRYNRLAAASTLMLPWEGATNAAASISIRSDAVVLGGLEDCIDGEVILAQPHGQDILTYGRPPEFIYPTASRTSTRMEGDEAATMRLLEGVPQYWWIEPLNGITGGATPLYVLRVFPQPDAVYSLIYRRKLWPTAITWAMVASTTEIPVLPHEEVHLVNLCQEALFSHPLWVGQADKDQVREAVKRARDWLGGQTPNQGHTQPALCRTKKGF